MAKKFVLFGAGVNGERALRELGEENVEAFLDNDDKKTGKSIGTIRINNPADYLNDHKDCNVLVVSRYAVEICDQLDRMGHKNYEVYLPKTIPYFSSEILVHNPYDYRQEAKNEQEYNEFLEGASQEAYYKYLNSCIDCNYKEPRLFDHIEIETYNRCNGGCSFCPVSIKNESRVEHKMEQATFEKIINELSNIDYKGKIALFSNNEPFLDDRILEFHKYAREKLPHARFHLFSNGTLLTLDKYIELMKYLDELIIDNYNQELKLIPNSKRIVEYCMEHKELICRTTVVLRKPQEILTSRGGTAPNRSEIHTLKGAKCILPFRQMIIRSDGKVSLCCNDPLGANTLGDVNKSSLIDIWYGSEFTRVREAIKKGREFWPYCTNCDVIATG